MWVHKQRAPAPDRDDQRQQGNHSCPAMSFWGAAKSLIAWISLDGIDFPIVRSTLWDAAPEGRTRSIILASPNRDRHHLKKFLGQFQLSDFLPHEVFSPAPHSPNPIPCCLICRFKDNVPLSLIHVPPNLHEPLKVILSAFLQAVYTIGLKKEPHSAIAQLCV